jgi:uncharacterized protein YuzE
MDYDKLLAEVKETIDGMSEDELIAVLKECGADFSKQIMKTKFQSKHNSFYIRVSDKPVAHSQEMLSNKEHIVVDFDYSGDIVGVEILGFNSIEVEAES